jgi:hypothetical protein
MLVAYHKEIKPVQLLAKIMAESQFEHFLLGSRSLDLAPLHFLENARVCDISRSVWV